MPNSEKRLADGKLTREIKRKKYEAKQKLKKEHANRERSRAKWFGDNSTFASLVSEEMVAAIRSNSKKEADSIYEALIPYFDVQDKSSIEAASKSCKDRLFIAEGTETIRILIQQQSKSLECNGLEPIRLKSIFVKPCLLFEPPVNLLTDVQEVARVQKDRHRPGFQVLVGSESVLSQVAGFHIARGALACGAVPNDRTDNWLNTFMRSRLVSGTRTRILALDGICDNANLGSMIRCASAFGVDVILLSSDTCDSWYRRTIRVSMGHIFRVPIVRVTDLGSKLKSLNDDFKIKSFAAVLETENLLTNIIHGTLRQSWCCVMGNEGNGISPAVRDASTQLLKIYIESDVDSLSVPIACGILLNGLREREGIMK
jgi:tRNA G18 (ribose-2'-O)-methylase SpoU